MSLGLRVLARRSQGRAIRPRHGFTCALRCCRETIVGNSVADQSTWGNQGRGINYKAKAWTEQLAKAKKAAKKKGAKAKGSKKKTKESKPPTSGVQTP